MCPHDTLKALLAAAVEMLLCPTVQCGAGGLRSGWGFDGWMKKRNCYAVAL